MAGGIIFPANPTINQLFFTNGLVYLWDGVKWISYPSDAVIGPVPEAPTDGEIYGRQGSTQTWQPVSEPATPPQLINVTGSGWSSLTPVLAYYLVDDGDTLYVQGLLSRSLGNNILPGTPNSIQLCTFPFTVAAGQQVGLCGCLAGVNTGYPPEALFGFGFLLLANSGLLSFFGTVPNTGYQTGTQQIYINNTFSLVLNSPTVAGDIVLPLPGE